MESSPNWFLSLLPDLPRWWEFCVLALVSVCLVGAGHLTMRYWHDRNETVPLPVALMLWVGMFAIYFAETVLFYQASPDTHKLGILAWCLIFWAVPATYYTFAVVTSMANNTIDRIGPYSAHIEDPSEFAAARKLALRGDVDGAVARYRNYREHRESALFEAARLLKSESRYTEAAEMFAEIARDFTTRLPVWAEATYQQAKLREVQLGDPRGAMDLMRKVLNRAPETRFSQMASADLARLQVLDADFLRSLEADDTVGAPQDPFYVRTQERQRQTEAASAQAPRANDTSFPAPAADPFYHAGAGETLDPQEGGDVVRESGAEGIRLRDGQEG